MPDDTLVQQDSLDTSTTRNNINVNNGGVPLLNENGKIYNEYLPTITGAVTSVNGQTGNVIVNVGNVSYNSTSKKLTYNQGASNVDELNIGSAVSLSNGVITTNDLRSATATFSSNITTPKIYGGSSSSSSLTLQPTSYGSYPNYLTISESARLTAGIDLMSSGSLNLLSDYGINLSGAGGLDISVNGNVSIVSAGSDIDIGSVNNVNVQCGGTFLCSNITTPKIYGGSSSSSSLTLQPTTNGSTPESLSISESYGSTGINILSSGSLTLGSDGYDLNINSDVDMHLSAINNVDVQCGGTFLYRNSEVLTRDNIASAGVGNVSYNSTSKKLTYNQGASNVDKLNIGSAVSLSNGVITTKDLRSSTATISSNITTPKIYGGSSSSSSLTLQPTSEDNNLYLTIQKYSYSSDSGINVLSPAGLRLSAGNGLGLISDGTIDITAASSTSISGNSIDFSSAGNIEVNTASFFLYRNSEVLTRDSIASADTPNKLNINKYNSSGYMPSGASGTAPDMSNSMTNMGFYVAAYFPLGNNIFRIWLSDKQQEMLLADDADGSGFTNKAGNAAYISYKTSESNLETSVKQFATKIQGYYQSATDPHPEVYFTFYNNPQCENGIRACSENSDFWRDISGIRTAIIVEAVFTGNNKGFPPVRYTVNELKGNPWRYGLVVSTPINPVTVSGSNVDFQSLGLVDFTLIAAVVGHNNRLLSIGTYAVGKEHSVLGMCSSAFGRANTVYTYCSLVSGQGNTTTCEKSFISGSYNTLNHGINSTALGWNNTVIGSETPRDQTSNFAIGTYNSVTNTTENTSSFAIGNHIKNTVSKKLSVGYYNDDNTDNIFEVGYGSGDTNRKNVFEVQTNGNTTISGNLWLGGSVINMLGSDNNRYRLSIDATGGTPTLVITPVS